ncbi:MAG: sulfatase-like hydrolase/transferase [Planctomycetota bacterium]
MNVKIVLRLVVAFVGICALGYGWTSPVYAKDSGQSKRRLPNVVFMFADDLGFGDLGCYGHPYAITPAIDQLAAEGTRFTQFYVTGVTCNPSRTGLMTGLFPARFPRYAADFGFGERTTITELLRDQGYATGHFGKWHIGPNDSNGTYGIDVIKTIGKSHDKEAGRDDDVYSAAIEFIRQNRDRPFYVNVWGHATHFPVNTPPGLVAAFDHVRVDRDAFSPTMQPKFDECLEIGGELDESMRQYLGDVYQIDVNVGRLLKTIDELGLRNDTLVVFSSDHGPAPVTTNKGAREFSKNMLGYAGPYRGGKHTQFEGGTRVPFIIRWPDQVATNRVDSESVCSFIDWLPTLCALTGANPPTEIDGEDISDIWLGQTRSRAKPLYWKVSSVGGTPAMREGRWKLHLPRRNRSEIELYDLEQDPSESRNVAGAFPEVIERMKKQLRNWERELPTQYVKAKR